MFRQPFFPCRPPSVYLVCSAVIALVCAPLVHAGTTADLDRENGLPDLKLGTPAESIQGLELVEELGRWTTYRRASDKVFFGKYPVSSVTYNFFKGKLYSIFMDVEGKHNTRGVLKALEATYGPNHTLEKHTVPHGEPKSALEKFAVGAAGDATWESREWAGSRVYLLYKNAGDFVGGQITLLDKPTWDKLQIPKQEQAVEQRKRLEGSYTKGDF